MSVDVASLVFEIDSTQAIVARQNLEAMNAVGAQSDAVARRVKTATEQAGIGLKASADGSRAAAKSATELATAQGAVEKASRGATAASAATRAQRSLEAAAMRELVIATKAYERDQVAAAKAVADAAKAEAAARAQSASQAAAAEAAAARAAARAAKDAAAEEVAASKARSAQIKADRALEAAAMRELVAATKAYDAEQIAAAKAVAAAEKTAAAERMAADRAAAAAAKGADAEAAAAARARAAAVAEVRALEAAAMREVVLASKQLDAEQTAAARTASALANKVDVVRGRLDPLAAVQIKAASATATLNTALEKGVITEAEHAALTLQVAKAAEKGAEGLTHLGGGAKVSGVQLQEFAHIARSATDAVAAGANPFRVIAMESGRFAQALGSGGGVSAVLNAILSPLGLAVIGFGALAIAAAGAVAAGVKMEAEYSKLGNALLATNDAVGMTAGQIEIMGKALADSTNTSVSSAVGLLTKLAATGEVSGASLGTVADASIRLSQITGEAADKISVGLVKSFDDASKGAVDLNNRIHFLTLAQYDQIDALQKAGDKQGAFNLLMKDLDDHLKTISPEMGFFERQWRGITDAIDGTVRALGNVGKTLPAALQLANDQKALSQYQSLNATQGDSAVRDKYIAALQQRIAGETIVANADARSAQVAAAADATQKAGIDATRHLQQVDTALGGSRERMLQEISDYKSNVAAALKANPNNATALADQANMAVRTAAIAKKYDKADYGAKAPSNDNATTLDTAQKAQISAQLSLTGDVERIAAIKHDEVAAELKLQNDRVAKLASEHHITSDTQKLANVAYQAAANAKDELIERQKVIGQIQAELDQRQAVAGYQDRIDAAQAMFAKSAEDQAAVEEDALADRQADERKATAFRLAQLLSDDKITLLQAAVQLSMEKEAQDAETAAKQRQDDIKIMEERAALAESALQRDTAILQANASLLTSSYARGVAEKSILALTQQEELVRAQLAIDVTTVGTAARAQAENAMASVKARQAADKKLLDYETRLTVAVRSAADAGNDFASALKDHDFGRALDDLQSAIDTVKKAFEKDGVSGGVYAAGSFIGKAVGGKVGGAIGDAANAGATALTLTGNPVIAAVAAAVVGIKDLLTPKASNNGAIATFSGNNFALGGDKRNDATSSATTAAANGVLQGMEALKAAGIGFTTTVKTIDLGTRDETHVILSNGQEIRTAVGDAAAAAEAGLKAVLQGATYASDTQKALVDSMLAAGQGFDAITTALQAYAAAQTISGALADQILQLQDPKAYDLKAVHDAIDAQKTAALAASAAGYLTADDLTKINAQLGTLEGLQLDAVLKKYATAAADGATTLADALTTANDNVDAARSAVQDAYDAETSAIRSNIDALTASKAALFNFSDSLTSGPLASLDPTRQLAVTRAQFRALAALPADDPTRVAGLAAAGDAFVTASKAASPTQAAFGRDLAEVRKATDQSVRAVGDQISIAQQQLDADNAAVAGLAGINSSIQTGTVTLATAIAGLTAAVAAQAIAQKAVDDMNTPVLAPNPALGPIFATASNDDNAATNVNIPASALPTPAEITSAIQASIQASFAGGGGANASDYGMVQHFATGGSGVVGGVGGADSQDVHMALTPGELVNVTRPGQGSSGDAEVLAELRALRAEVVQLRGSAETTAKNTGNLSDKARRDDQNGTFVRGADPDAPLNVKVA